MWELIIMEKCTVVLLVIIQLNICVTLLNMWQLNIKEQLTFVLFAIIKQGISLTFSGMRQLNIPQKGRIHVVMLLNYFCI